MTPEQIDLVQESLRSLDDRGDEVVAAFYEHLFATAPETREMFPDDMDAQRENFLVTLTAIGEALGDFEGLAARTRDLGARHRGYGVRARHYPVVGDALLRTIQEAMGPRFTPAHADAWRQGYTLIAEFMQQGAAVSRPATRLGGRTA